MACLSISIEPSTAISVSIDCGGSLFELFGIIFVSCFLNEAYPGFATRIEPLFVPGFLAF
jgi:hypothetical protein